MTEPTITPQTTRTRRTYHLDRLFAILLLGIVVISQTSIERTYAKLLREFDLLRNAVEETRVVGCPDRSLPPVVFNGYTNTNVCIPPNTAVSVDKSGRMQVPTLGPAPTP